MLEINFNNNDETNPKERSKCLTDRCDGSGRSLLSNDSDSRENDENFPASRRIGIFSKLLSKSNSSVCFRINTILLAILGLTSIAIGILLVIYPLFKSITKLRLEMTPGLPPFNNWVDPKPEVFCRAYIFTVTNPKEFLDGTDKKLKVEEIGPIVYQERLEHTNVVFHENSTMSYTVRRWLEYLPDQNEPGILNRTIIVPNIVLLGMAATLADYMFTVKMAFNMISQKDSLFLNTTVYNYFWNLTTPALVTVDKYLPFMVPQDNGGTLHSVYKDYTDHVNVRIGPKYSYEDFFMINTYNHRPTVPGYRPENGDCFASLVNSTEGALYPNFLTKDSVILYWRKAVCRPVPLYFQEEVYRGSLLGYKYVTRVDWYDRNENLTADCYKGFGYRPLPDGLSDVSKCYNNLPITVSAPHFYGRNGIWDDQVEGFSPSLEKHGSYAIIEPVNGVPLDQKARSQSNMVLPKLRGFNADINRFSEMVVPIIWCEYHLPKLTPEINSLLQFTSNFLPTLQYVAPVIFILTGLLYIYFLIRRIIRSNSEDTSNGSKRNSSFKNSKSKLFWRSLHVYKFNSSK